MARKLIKLRARGKKPITMRKGGLHRTVGVPEGEKIPASKVRAARAGRYGPLGKKQAVAATGLLAAGRRTAARKRKARRSASPACGPTQAGPM